MTTAIRHAFLNGSERVLSDATPKQVKPSMNLLQELLEARSAVPSRKTLEALGSELARVIGRPASRAFRYRHLLSVARGLYEPGRELERAIRALLAATDGTHPLLAAAEEATAFFPPGSEASGAYIPGEIVTCAGPYRPKPDDPPCLVRFARDHPQAIRCPNCRQRRKPK